MEKINLKRRLAAYVRQRMKGRVLYTKQGREPLYVSTVIRFMKDGVERKADISVFRILDDGKAMPFAVFYVASSADYEDAKVKANEFVNCHNYSLMEAFVFDCERMRLSVFKGNGDSDTYSKMLGKDVKELFKGVCSVKVSQFDTIGNAEEEEACIGMSFTPMDHTKAIYKLMLYLDSMGDKLKAIIKDDYAFGSNSALLAHGRGEAPDVFVSKDVDSKKVDTVPYIIIEVAHNKGMWYDRNKMKKLLKRYKPSDSDPTDSNKRLLEYYIYNYETDVWESYGPNADPERPSYSKMLDADLNDAFRGKAKVVYEF